MKATRLSQALLSILLPLYVYQIHINGVYPVPQFINCSFESNSLVGRRHCLGQGYDFAEVDTEFDTSGCSVTISETGDGTIVITGFTVQFLGNTRVANNRYLHELRHIDPHREFLHYI